LTSNERSTEHGLSDRRQSYTASTVKWQERHHDVAGFSPDLSSLGPCDLPIEMQWDPMRTEASLRCHAAVTCIVHRPSPLLSDTVFGSPLDGARKEPADRNWDPMWTEMTWTAGTTSRQPSPCSPHLNTMQPIPIVPPCSPNPAPRHPCSAQQLVAIAPTDPHSVQRSMLEAITFEVGSSPVPSPTQVS
jgi:hypothetical protein